MKQTTPNLLRHNSLTVNKDSDLIKIVQLHMKYELN